ARKTRVQVSRAQAVVRSLERGPPRRSVCLWDWLGHAAWVVEQEPPKCPDGHTLARFTGETLHPDERPEVEAHVEGCATCRERLAAMIGDSPTNQFEAQLSRRPDPVDLPQAGDVIVGKYRVDSVIGAGGMGVVLGARHIELGHLIAIKVMRSRNPLATPRFLREARTTVRLSGEHVVRVFDYGKLEHGSPFLVMEYLHGEDLAKVIARGIVPIDTALRYMIEACEALEEAHGLGVVHRDFKPGNLFVVYDAKGETRIKVLDFGISKLLDSDDGASELTESDAVMGSPLYMSPEQVRASRDVDLRTDIWAVGVVLYELVAGVSPFAGPTAPAVAVNVTFTVPTPLSTLRAGVTASLEAVVERCLEKEPGARFQSVNELAGALRAVLGAYQLPGGAVHAPRRWGRVVAAGAVVLVLAGALFWALRSGQDGRTEQKIQAITSTPSTVLPLPAARNVQPAAVAEALEAEPPSEPEPKPEPVRAQEIERTSKGRSLDIGEVLPP
ncbi:MAG TPA: serine/threonine-protein kinase, partial [Polyangiales bacterium]|nr:serine/threonine-protein kinase [Polyangiales bacterium]